MRIRFENGNELDVSIEAGAIEIAKGAAVQVIVPAKKVDYAPYWSVIVTGAGDDSGARHILSIQLKIGKAVYLYSGDPKFTNAYKKWDGGGCFINFGREVPADIEKKYAKQWNKHPHLRACGASYETAQEQEESVRQRNFELYEAGHAPGAPNPYAKA